MKALTKLYNFIIFFIILSFIALIIFSNVFIVKESEEAIILRFGEYKKKLEAGLYIKIPIVEEVYKVPFHELKELTFEFNTQERGPKSPYKKEGLMITGDLNIINLEWTIQYKIREPFNWTFKVEERENTIKDISKSVINRIVGEKPIFEVINESREEISFKAREEMNRIVEKYELGIEVIKVILKNTMPIEGDVYKAFEEVNIAIEEKKKYINEGKKEFNEVIPKIKGEAEKIIEEAKGEREARVNNAKAEVELFNSIYSEYVKNPKITKERLYFEAMQEVLRERENIQIIDKNLKNLPPFQNTGELK